jgi:hypothetical protein
MSALDTLKIPDQLGAGGAYLDGVDPVKGLKALLRMIAGRIGDPVANETALGAVLPINRTDGQIVVVGVDQSIWKFDAASTAAAQTNEVIVPADAPSAGRWIAVTVRGSPAVAPPVRLASAAAITGTYLAGVFTVTATGALSIDGVGVALGDLVLLKNQASGSQNGIYEVTNPGDTGIHPVLTRAVNFSTSSAYTPGLLVATGPEGSANPSKVFELTSTAPTTLDTTSLTWALAFSALPSTTAGKIYFDTGTTVGETAAGTAHQVLHGAAGAPTWSAVDLTADVSNQLPMANIAPGTAGQIPVTNSGATQPVMVSVSGDATLASTGALTVAAVGGLAFFAIAPVLAISVANVSSLSGPQTVDGVSLVAGNRVYLAKQTTASQNGLWVVQTGAWTRPTDWATGTTPPTGTRIRVAPGGTTNYAKYGSEWFVYSVSGGAIDTGTVIAYPVVVRGQGALSSGTPSTLTIASAWVLSATTSVPTIVNMTNVADTSMKAVLAADASPGSGDGTLTVTGPNTITDTVGWSIRNA